MKGAFENYVNYAGSKTQGQHCMLTVAFENYVNYAGSKTQTIHDNATGSLRTM